MAIERARLFTRSAEFGAAEERNRLAREIHDTLAQGLAGIALQLEIADALLEADADPARVRQAISQAMKLARSNLEEARRSVLDLRAAPLEGRTLSEALDALVHDWAVSANIQTIFNRIGENRPLPARIEASLYRIAQEALTNAIRHAEAQRIAVALTIKPERVDLLIEDNGRGFDVAQVPKDRYGLIGLNERVKLLGGTMHIHSSIGEGTRLDVSVPLESKS
jgi:two-component system NarL family sensor kinase